MQDLQDKAGLALGSIGIGVKTNRFTVRFSDGSSKPIELYADDAQTKSEWLQGIGSGSFGCLCYRVHVVVGWRAATAELRQALLSVFCRDHNFLLSNLAQKRLDRFR